MTAPAGPSASDGPGGLLVSFARGAESEVPGDAPMPLALTAARHRDEFVMVHDRHRDGWELPGGMPEPGETARRAAGR
ncbi:NUDIX domain-containing protein [Streptomyces sp. NPDC051051]|uniref:NUDIX domain-containing protein n=1 Tax=Streptomyces sp. NPDC051051 TaxID=3155666 RepID=UPI003443F6C9